MPLRTFPAWPLAVALGLALLPAGCQVRTKAPPAGGAPGTVPGSPAGQAPAAAADPHADMYGDTGGEAVLPATQTGAPLRARKTDSFYRLTGARFEPVGKKPFPFLAIDYERLRDGWGGVSVVVRGADGRDRSYLILGPMSDRAGTLEIDLGIPRPGDSPIKEGEVYFTRQEHRYGNEFRPTFKVSTSAIMGATKFPVTLARNWTAEEAAKLRQPPFELIPNQPQQAGIGQDTKFAGDPGAPGFRYLIPGKPVIGADWYLSSWDNEPCLGRFMPVYEAKQPTGGQTRTLAKEGYALGGLNVRTKRFVNQVQMVFMKLTADGKLDPKDSYTSDWLGPQVEGAKEVKLGGDGRPVIGFHCQQGGILNAIALVQQ